MDIKPINPFKRLFPCECPKCGNNTISMYDKYDKRINYALLCRYNTFEQIKKKIENTDLRYMRCDSCKSVFILDWTKQIIPYPNTKEVYKEFEKEE